LLSGAGGTSTAGSGGLGQGGTTTGGLGGIGGIGIGGISASGGSKGTGGAGGNGGIDGGGGYSGTARGGAGGWCSCAAGGSIGTSPLDGGARDAPVPSCSELATQSECDTRNDCHSLFEDPGTCGCASPGCCARFKSCASGDKAECAGPVVCVTDPPLCERPYVLSYTGLCYAGCVQESDCARPVCPQAAPTNGDACAPGGPTCYYENCGGAGRTLATCSNGTWQVQTAACESFACEAEGSAAGSISCAAGKLCVLTMGAGSVVTPACVDHSCGTGLIGPTCAPALRGSCTISYTLGGVVAQCFEVSN
jgi:hypothetical protein